MNNNEDGTIRLSAIVPPEDTNVIEEKTIRVGRNVTPNVNFTTEEIKKDNSSERIDIDPSIIFKSSKEDDMPNDMVSNAYNLLDKAIERKTVEFREAIDKMKDQDETNRIAVAEGIETVEGELKYMVKNNEEDTTENMITEEKETLDEVEIDLMEEDRNARILAKNGIKTNVNTTANDIFNINSEIPSEEDEISIHENIEDIENKKVVIKDNIIKNDNSDLIKESVKTQENILRSGVKSIIKTNSAVTSDKPVSEKQSDNIFEIDPEDISDLEDEEENDVKKASNDGYLNLKNDILKKIVNVSKRLDTSSFNISKNVITIQAAIRKSGDNDNKKSAMTSSFPLMHSGRMYTSSAVTGPELIMLQRYNRDGYMATVEQARILYKHDQNPYKPGNFNDWAKTIPFMDMEYMFAALYMANFEGANFVPYACEDNHCGFMFLSESINIKDMIKFPNKKVEERFNNICNKEITPEESVSIETVAVPINDQYAFGLRIPSIYNILVEVGSVNTEFANKYSEIITLLSYVDTIYYIDSDNNALVPIGYKTYVGDPGKTFKSKVASYAKILETLPTQDYNVLTAYINSTADSENDIEFYQPASTCSKCGKKIEERKTLIKDEVFTRQRLVDIATTPREF